MHQFQKYGVLAKGARGPLTLGRALQHSGRQVVQSRRAGLGPPTPQHIPRLLLVLGLPRKGFQSEPGGGPSALVGFACLREVNRFSQKGISKMAVDFHVAGAGPGLHWEASCCCP